MKTTAAALFIFCLRLFLAASPVHAQSGVTPVPEMTAYVADVAGVLTQAEKDRFIAQIRDLASRTGSQLGVVVVDHTDPESIEEFAQRVFNTWKLGRKGVDDGVLLVLAVNNQSRRLRIHVGYGLEGTITDAVAKRLLAQDVRVALEQAGPGQALDKGVSALTALMLKANTKESKEARDARDAAIERLLWGSLAQIGLLLVTVVLMKRRIRLKTRLLFIVALSFAASAIYIWAAGNVWWAFAGAIWLGIAVVMTWKNWTKATSASPLPEPAPAPRPPLSITSASAGSALGHANHKGRAWRHVPLVDRSGEDRRGFVADDHVPVRVGLPIMVPLHFAAAAFAATVGVANGSDTTISAIAGVGWWILATTIFTQLTTRHGLIHAAKKRRRGSRRSYDGDSSSGWGSDSGG